MPEAHLPGLDDVAVALPQLCLDLQRWKRTELPLLGIMSRHVVTGRYQLCHTVSMLLDALLMLWQLTRISRSRLVATMRGSGRLISLMATCTCRRDRRMTILCEASSGFSCRSECARIYATSA